MTTGLDVTHGVQALILAGGQGERLYPLTASRPKPAVPFGGVFRIVDFTLSNCLNSGLSRVSLLTQYKHEQLQAYIEQSWTGLWAEMKRDDLKCIPPSGGNRYRGTADAVLQNIEELPRTGTEQVLILAADHVYRMDYRRLLRHHNETHADLTVASVDHSLAGARRFGVLEVDAKSEVVGFEEKPSNPRSRSISMGIYVFRREVLVKALKRVCSEDNGYDFGQHIIPSLVGSARVHAYHFGNEARGLPSYWRDIGTLDSYYEASMDLVSGETPFDPYSTEEWPTYPVRYSTLSPIHSRLRTNCRVTRSILSPGVLVEDGASIESSVLMSGARIGKDTRIRKAIIEEGVHIPAGFQIGFDLDSDRKHYFVTDAGVVVVSQTPKHTRPTVESVPMQARHLRVVSSRVA